LNLLVGGTGFVGGHVVEYLFQQGEISKGIFRMGSHLKTMDSNGVQGIEADLLDHHSLHEAMEGVDVVYSMASPMPDEGGDFLRVNTEGILNLLEVAGESKAKAFVHLSTLDVFGFETREVSLGSPMKPRSGYQKAKAEAERVLQEHAKRKDLPRISIVRAAKAVGARDESLARPILKMLERGKVVLPSSGPMSFSNPRDIAQAMFKASSRSSESGNVYLVKSFDASPEEFASEVVAMVGAKAEVRRAGFLSGSEVPKYSAEQLRAALRVMPQENWAAIGFAPECTLKSTSAEVAEWYRKEPWSAGAA
jgi:nucleoside-diphosphate-sugar epimerase